MEFSYERTLDNPALANCSFSCDLEGDLSLRNLDFTSAGTANRRLIQAAVELSKERINATYGNCLITRMRITEREMLSKFAIRFELDAQFRPDTSASNNALTAIAYMVGQGFKVRRFTSPEVWAYGSAARDYVDGNVSLQSKIWAMLPHYLDNTLCGDACASPEDQLPYANYLQYTTSDPSLGTITVVRVETPLGNQASNTTLTGKFSAAQAQPAATVSGGSTYGNIVSHSASITKVTSDQGISRLPVMYRNQPDLVFQVRKPEVRIKERVEVVQLNTAPARIVRPMAANSYLVREDWDVTYGRFDASGNRMFTGIFEREYALYDIGGDAALPSPTANGFYDFTGTSGPLNGDKVRAWTAPAGVLLPTISPVATGASQGTSQSVFSNTAATADERYTVLNLPPAT
jgi:hypothetical protein